MGKYKILSSHNSWTFLKPRKWWMYLIRWAAKCQSKDIREQYEAGVRCFDLRLKFRDGIPTVAHGYVDFNYTSFRMYNDLQFLNEKGDCMVRVLHEVRKVSELTDDEIHSFCYFCGVFEAGYSNIRFFGGQNLIDWHQDYKFVAEEPSIEDAYGSVAKRGTIYEAWPWLYAKLYNARNLERGTDKDVMMIDFV